MIKREGRLQASWARTRRRRPVRAGLRLAAALAAILFTYLTTRNLRRLGATREVSLSHATSPPPRPLRCADRSAECHAWTADGQCDSNPSFMLATCAESCSACAPYVYNVPSRVLLVSNHTMPSIGFGTAGLGSGTQAAVAAALTAGYLKIDSAQAREWYREDLVGAALAASAAPRSRLFITTKVHPRDFGARATRAAALRSRIDLRTGYLDLVLLHYAECWGDLCKGAPPLEGTWRDAWRALEQLVDERVVRSIGVSNFNAAQIADLSAWARIRPALVQLNSEPLRPAAAEQALCRRLGIQFESYSTLGGQYDVGEGGTNPVLTNPTVAAIAAAKRATPAQVVLRWALQSGQTVVPRSADPAHMRQNLAALEIVLSDEEMDSLGALAASRRRQRH